MPGRRTWTWTSSVAVLVAVYGGATLTAYLVAEALPMLELWQAVLIADVAATLVVYVVAVALDNTSVYDPYWSVAPALLAAYLFVHHGESPGNSLRFALVELCLLLWGARLTWNFLRGWPGLHHEDWRYTAYRRFGLIGYWALSLFGLMLFPTLLVFGAMLPVYALTRGAGAPVGALDVLAVALALGSLYIEARADNELRAFVASKPDKQDFIKTGLWAWSRHPNYLGEVGFWWGIFLFGLAASPAGNAWTVVGPVAITVLFRFISIPMMEKRMVAKRPAYAEHQKRVGRLFPIPGRRA